MQIVALWVIALSFAFAAVYAWFFRDDNHNLPLDPAHFEVIITYDGKTSSESGLVQYIAHASTYFSNPGDEDQRFNMCVTAAEVEIKNIGEVGVKARVAVSVVNSITIDEVTGLPIPRNDTESAIKYALIDKSLQDVAGVLDSFGDVNYRQFILNQMAAGSYAAIADMNDNMYKNVIIEQGSSLIFLLAFWVDYGAVGAEYGYAPGQTMMYTTYDLSVKVSAVDENAP